MNIELDLETFEKCTKIVHFLNYVDVKEEMIKKGIEDQNYDIYNFKLQDILNPI